MQLIGLTGVSATTSIGSITFIVSGLSITSEQRTAVGSSSVGSLSPLALVLEL